MNNLLTESFERIMGRYPGEPDGNSGRFSPDSRDLGMDKFFKQVAEIETQIENITTLHRKLEASNEECRLVTKASAMKEIKKQMEKDVEEVTKIAHKAKTSLEQLDRENLTNRQKPGCEKGTGVDRSRTSMTVALKKRLKERMSQFQILRQNIRDEYREVIERRVFTVTGTRPDEETIDQLIETGASEHIFSHAIQGYGRGQIVETVSEIQERHDAFLELEKKLQDLQQMFMDMAVLVEAQGDMIDDIEAQVTKSVDHVQKATETLKQAKKKQRNTRKYMCLTIIILLFVVIFALWGILKRQKVWG
ncbi:Syntaxin [Rhynchospora pubera]|nr:Syntaxin [Rhynchospora pubera]KAJ4773569.1 Syntaxin [Rhynchospora pubera]KAJ4778133.1 Syntaxin [Rhynchospora pubera]KAJ4784999.1 Syntaxin [Rhynchospora pubera]